MTRRWWLELAAVAPLALIGVAGLVAVLMLVGAFIAQNPLIHGGIVVFSVWLVLGISYLVVTSEPY